jgi:F-type H+-transporting ATPase subunit a
MLLTRFIKLLILPLMVMVPSLVNAGTEAEEAKEKAERKEFITHHLKDAHSFHIVGHVGFPLPVILYDGELHMFMSSAFGHEEELVAESNGKFFKIYEGKIFATDAAGTITINPTTNHPDQKEVYDMSITKNVFVVILIGALMLWLFIGMAKSYQNSLVPSGAAKFFEPLVLYVRDEIAIPNIGEKHYQKYMGYLLSVFFFVWIINLVGLTPLGINVTGNIAITASLALMTLFITLYTSNKNYWAHIFWMPGVPKPMRIVLMPIELLGVIIKPFALLIRLYANIKAGHIVLMSIIAVMYTFENWGAKGAFLFLDFFLSALELLVAFLQAYIFTMLSALYFGAACEEHHHEEHHEGAVAHH